MTPNSPIISDHLSLREVADQRILNRGSWYRFLVTNVEGQLLGEITIDALKSIPVERWSEMQVGELVQPIDTSRTVLSQKPLLDVVKLLEENQLNALTVIRDNGTPVGLLEKPSIINLLQHRPQVASSLTICSVFDDYFYVPGISYWGNFLCRDFSHPSSVRSTSCCTADHHESRPFFFCQYQYSQPHNITVLYPM